MQRQPISKASDVLDVFIVPLFSTFQPNNDDPAVMAMAQMAYAKNLMVFTTDTLARALEWFQEYRKDRFMPTIAECVEIAKLASDPAYMPASLEKMIARQKHRAQMSDLARDLVDGKKKIEDGKLIDITPTPRAIGRRLLIEGGGSENA